MIDEIKTKYPAMYISRPYFLFVTKVKYGSDLCWVFTVIATVIYMSLCLSVQVLLIVNVASECGYTHTHYYELVKLQRDLEFTGLFHVLAFPCNQFGQQEPKVMNYIQNYL